MVHLSALARIADDSPVAWVVGSGSWGGAVAAIPLVRAACSEVPILAVADHGRALVAARRAGADDALIWPFRPDELFARLEILLESRNLGDVDERPLLDAETLEIRLAAVRVVIRRAEFDVLSYLVAQRPRVVSSRELLQVVLGTTGDGGTVRTHIWEIRRKLAAVGLALRLRTHRACGYQISDDRWLGPPCGGAPLVNVPIHGDLSSSESSRRI